MAVAVPKNVQVRYVEGLAEDYDFDEIVRLTAHDGFQQTLFGAKIHPGGTCVEYRQFNILYCVYRKGYEDYDA